MQKASDHLCPPLRDETLGRRQFLTSTAAMGLSATAGSALAQSPRRGGNLVIGIGGASSSDTFDPATWNSPYRQTMGMQVYDTLITSNEKLILQPWLAESWE